MGVLMKTSEENPDTSSSTNKQVDYDSMMVYRGGVSPPLFPPPRDAWPHPPQEGEMPLCAGCRLRIVDKFYLRAVDRKWHSACLKCVECGVELETQVSCFEKDGHIYCKEDYLRVFGQHRQCSRCLQEILTTDLVMKARHCLFHVDCFRCTTCDTVLRKGDLFGMHEDILYCRLHYEIFTSGGFNTAPPLGSTGSYEPDNHSPPIMGDPMYGPPPPPIPPVYGAYPPPPPPGEPGWFPPCGPGDFPMGEFPYDNNNDPLLKKRRGRKKRKVENFAAMNGYLDASGYPTGMDGQGQTKTKRARTSFKHHQLRIMKAHFQINQNPDSRELKMLSSKTGLDKKVLQVWFQNARAKWRRTKAQDGVPSSSASLPGGGTPGGPDLLGPEESGMSEPSPSSDCSGNMISCC